MATDPLKVFDAVISMSISQAVQAGLVTGIVSQAFAKDRSFFFTNPANGLAYSALRALEKHSIVHIIELMKTELASIPGVAFSQKARLYQHRVVISHPYRTEFTNPNVQKFYDSDGQYLDNRLGLIWGFATELHAHLRAAGGQSLSEEIRISLEMGELYTTILRRSLKPEHAHVIPDPEKGIHILQTFATRYLTHVLSLYDED